MNLLEEYSEDELLNINTNFLRLAGVKLKKKAWFKDRGLRVKQDYVYPPTGEVKVSEIYDYAYDNDKREVVSYSRRLEWYDDGAVVQSQDTTPDLTVDHITDVNKSARNAQVEYLELAADNLRNTADAAVHQIPVRQPDAHFPNGLNVKQAIMYQLKGLVP